MSELLSDHNIKLTCEQLQPEFSKLLSSELAPLDDNAVDIELMLDREVVDFFKEHSKHYQVKINEALMMLVHQYKHLKQ